MLKYCFICVALLTLNTVSAHEGHNYVTVGFDSIEDFLHWIGNFHFVILHFPIALIMMTVVAELLFIWFRKPLYEQAAYFMILAAAIWAPPTAFLGYALSYNVDFSGINRDLFVWHRYFGSVTALLAIVTAYLRYAYVNQKSEKLSAYYVCLFFLFICVSLTGMFGGALVFGT